MIERILIHRFRGVRQGQIEGLRKLNVFIGPNNSGKTAMLELLYLSATSGRPVQFIRDDLLPAETGALEAATSVRSDLLGYEPLPRLRVRHGKRGGWTMNPAVVTVEGGLEIDLTRLSIPAYAGITPPWERFRLGTPLPEKDFTQEDIQCVAMFSLPHPNALDTSMIPLTIAEAGIKPNDAGWYYLWEPDWVYRWEQQQPIDTLAIWATLGAPPHPERVLLYDFNTANSHFNDQFAKWAYRTIPGWHEKIAERMTQVFPELQGAIVEVLDAPDDQRGRTGYIRFPERRPMAIDHFGDGARHAFKLLAALIALAETVDAEHPGMVLWEEPELFMHAATLGRLLNTVADIISNKPIQACITTQSLEVLSWLAVYLDEQPAIEPDHAATFHLHLESGQLNVRPFIGKALGGWLHLFGDPRLLEEDELASPLLRLLGSREEAQ